MQPSQELDDLPEISKAISGSSGITLYFDEGAVVAIGHKLGANLFFYNIMLIASRTNNELRKINLGDNVQLKSWFKELANFRFTFGGVYEWRKMGERQEFSKFMALM